MVREDTISQRISPGRPVPTRCRQRLLCYPYHRQRLWGEFTAVRASAGYVLGTLLKTAPLNLSDRRERSSITSVSSPKHGAAFAAPRAHMYISGRKREKPDPTGFTLQQRLGGIRHMLPIRPTYYPGFSGPGRSGAMQHSSAGRTKYIAGLGGRGNPLQKCPSLPSRATASAIPRAPGATSNGPYRQTFCR